MRATSWIVTASLLTAAFALPGAVAHEHYQSDDGMFSIVLGEQNEPVYTYDWTNLDLIVHEDPENGTGGAVPGVHETVNATLIAPGGEELSLPIEPQFGEKGRYEFVEDYYLTQPGQYEVRLEGHINGTDVTGTYDLPGPRESMSGFGFPAETVPSPLELQERLDTLAEDRPDTSELEQKVTSLEQQVSTLENKLSQMESQVQALEQKDAGSGTSQQGAPGAGALVAVLALAGVAGLTLRRKS